MSNTRKVNPLEQHIEKLALLVAIVLLGWVAFAYWFNDPYTIELNGETVRPGQIDGKILEEAERLEAELKSPSVPPLLEEVRVPDYNQQFVEKLKTDVIGREEIVAINIEPFMRPSTIIPDEPQLEKYHVPQVPAPTIYAVRSELNTLKAIELEQREGLARYVPVGGPYDFAYASVRAQFDARTMFEQLVFEPDADADIKPLKPGWWTQMFWIFDVEVQRQTKQADGSWSEPVTLAPMPGQPSVRQKLAGMSERSAEKIGELMTEVSEKQAEIIQPSPLNMVKAWTAPEPVDPNATLQAGEGLGLREIERQIKLKNAQIKNLQIQIERMNRAGQRRGGSGGAPPRTGGLEEEFGGELGSGGITGRSPSATTGTQGKQQRYQQRIQQLTTEIQELQTQYQQKTGTLPPGAVAPGSVPGLPGEGLEEEFGPGGFDPTRPGGFDPEAPRSRPGGPGALEEEFLLEGEFGLEPGVEAGRAMQPKRPIGANVFQFGEEIIDLYANDLDVKPGKTYRYRVRVRVYNPLFMQAMVEEQAKKFKDKFTLDSDWSDWSEPTTVEKMTHYFVSNGGTGNARIKVFKFSNGNWRDFDFTVPPGDPVGWPVSERGPNGNPTTIDLSTGAYILDIERIEIPGRIKGLNRQTTRVLIIDDDEIVARTVEDDRNHPKLRYLQDQQAIRKATLSASTR